MKAKDYAAKNYQTIKVVREGLILKISLNRPQVHNAFNIRMIEELLEVFRQAQLDSLVRLVIFTGEGKSFCAGADLNWMREIINYSFEQNLAESLRIAELLYQIYMLSKPVIALVNGAAIGGGVGFVSACDIILASEKAKFGLSEVKIGLVPAAISPYVVRRIGEAQARRYFLTGERVSAQRALEIGLVNEVVTPEKLLSRGEEVASLLLSSGPEALARCKELLSRVPGMAWEEAKQFTARMIAKLRISQEGQEGMAAFLEKRAPRWVKNPSPGEESPGEEN
ncbi:MAG TPA: enoyl-CoA hydratase/isomerase family protein [Candidatus Aminicenantes bacterium]|nr:enoyl-CoA hydratase/isomerase family protein [Candidatus Aminicenantes bacterium]